MTGFDDPFAPWRALRRDDAITFDAVGQAFARTFAGEHPGYARIRPGFPPLTAPAAAVHALADTTARLLALLGDLAETLLADGRREALGLTASEAAAFAEMLSPEFAALSGRCARADYLLTPAGPRLMEMNASAAIGGIGILGRYDQVLERALMATGLHGWRDGLAPLATDAMWADSVKAVLRRHSEPPVIAVACLSDEMDIPPPVEAARVLAAAGFDVALVATDELAVGGGGVRAAGRRVDAVYGCFAPADLRRPGLLALVRDLVSADRDGLVRYFLPPLAGIRGSKALLGELWARLAEGRLSAVDATLVRAVVPETCVVTAAIRDWALAAREALVLKPSVGHGGAGVEFGAATPAGQWRRRLEEAAAHPGSHVLQRACPALDVPMPIPGAGVGPEGEAPHQVVLGALSFGGVGAGILARIRPSGGLSPINCSHGSAFAPCYALR